MKSTGEEMILQCLVFYVCRTLIECEHMLLQPAQTTEMKYLQTGFPAPADGLYNKI